MCNPDNNNLAICTCLPNYLGSPPYCRAECTTSEDCPNDLACLQQKCKNPCLGVCGRGAQCEVFKHHAVCTCPQGYTGNSFESCEPILQTPSKKNFLSSIVKDLTYFPNSKLKNFNIFVTILVIVLKASNI